MATRGYIDTTQAVKMADPGPTDHVLLKLGADGGAEILFLTTPSPVTRRRLRRFCRAVIETPAFPAIVAAR